MAETYINKCKILGTAKKEYFKRIEMENLMYPVCLFHYILKTKLYKSNNYIKPNQIKLSVFWSKLFNQQQMNS
jgi:hypothetical protein